MDSTNLPHSGGRRPRAGEPTGTAAQSVIRRCTARPWLRLIPNPFDCLESLERLRHQDVPQLSSRRLWGEMVAIEGALGQRLFDPSLDRWMLDEHLEPSRESVWLRQRFRRLQGEAARRRRETRVRRHGD